MELPPIRNLFKGGKLVGKNVDSRAYHGQAPNVERGHPQFVLSRSELMLFAGNPQRWIDGYAPKETDATEWGSLIDCLLLDKERLNDKFALQPETQEATKTMQCVKEGEACVGDQVPWSPTSSFAKQWNKEQIKAGKTIVKASDYKDAQQAVEKVLKDPKAGELIRSSSFQVMCVSTYYDAATELSIPVKALIDLVPALETPFQNGLADFKTARNGEPEEWRGVCEKRHYDVQAVMNLHVYEAATGEAREDFRHIVQENEFPYSVGRRVLESPTIAIGWMKMVSALELYAKCLKSNTWPGWDDMPWSDFSNFDGWTGVRPKDWTLVKYLGEGARRGI
jgi:hypothetical protein